MIEKFFEGWCTTHQGGMLPPMVSLYIGTKAKCLRLWHQVTQRTLARGRQNAAKATRVCPQLVLSFCFRANLSKTVQTHIFSISAVAGTPEV